MSNPASLKDETGNVYGALTVTKRIQPKVKPKDSRKQRAYWQCKCQCGDSIIASGIDLRQGKVNYPAATITQARFFCLLGYKQ
jgi:hypothetical protein